MATHTHTHTHMHTHAHTHTHTHTHAHTHTHMGMLKDSKTSKHKACDCGQYTIILYAKNIRGVNIPQFCQIVLKNTNFRGQNFRGPATPHICYELEISQNFRGYTLIHEIHGKIFNL